MARGAHAAAGDVDAPALAGGVARPDERDRAPVARRGAKPPDHRLADDRRRGEILEADAIEDVLARGQILDQDLGGEIAFRQRIGEHAVADRPKLSVVEISTCMRAGRSERAQTTPESTPTSPDCSPWLTAGRSAARLR
jgi:hypothetical protein